MSKKLDDLIKAAEEIVALWRNEQIIAPEDRNAREDGEIALSALSSALSAYQAEQALESDPNAMKITIGLDMPPGVNKLYLPVPAKDKNGRLTAKIIKSNICREWASYAQHKVLHQRSGLTIPYRFKIRLILPESPLDSDAPIKETLDACQHGGAIINDKHCMGGTWDVDETRPPGSMLVELTATNDPMPPEMLKKLLAKRNQGSFSL